MMQAFSIFLFLFFIILGLWPDKIIQSTEDLTDKQRTALKHQKFILSLMTAVIALAIAIGPSRNMITIFSIFIGLLGLYQCITYLQQKVIYMPMGMGPSQIWRGNIAIVFCLVMILMTILLILTLQIQIPMFWNYYEVWTGQ